MSNVYYNPEKFGLTQVAHTDIGSGYDFRKMVIWRDEGADYYYAKDSGCSCPSPFKNYTSLADLTRIESHSFESFEQAARDYFIPYEIKQIKRDVFTKRYARPSKQAEAQSKIQKAVALSQAIDERISLIERKLELAIDSLQSKGVHMHCPEGITYLNDIAQPLDELKTFSSRIGGD